MLKAKDVSGNRAKCSFNVVVKGMAIVHYLPLGLGGGGANSVFCTSLEAYPPPAPDIVFVSFAKIVKKGRRLDPALKKEKK